MKKELRQILNWDAKISKTLLLPDNKSALAWIMKIFAHSADSWFWISGLILVWFFAKGAWRERALFLAAGLFIMAIAVILLKFLIRRPRPEGEWGQIYRITDPHSFPSGHAARSAALMVMALALGPPWFGVVTAIWAPWVGISRVALGVHYIFDVLAGWVVGAMMGLIALALKPLLLQVLSFLL
ncbi:MAG: phosphatase PAP2 family protein [Brevefilum sp.]|jgi:undecaprenyl-diphosphatase